MKHLYIIGNGFDLFTGLHTSYSDFKHWLEHKYIFVYENMKAAYNMDGKWWNNFEVNLGELDIHQFVRNLHIQRNLRKKSLNKLKNEKII